MSYSLLVSDELDKLFSKLAKKDINQILIINKKINQILKKPYHFKPLRGDMKGSRRVHIDKSFVLVYDVDEKNKVVRILDYAHHDKVY